VSDWTGLPPSLPSLTSAVLPYPNLRVPGACLQTLQGHDGTVRCLADWAHNGLISGGVDKIIRLWSAGTGTLCAVVHELSDVCMCADGVAQHKLSGHGDHVYSLLVLANDRLASGSRDNTAKIWLGPCGDIVLMFCLRKVCKCSRTCSRKWPFRDVYVYVCMHVL
jgi:WD40 repeat protein